MEEKITLDRESFKSLASDTRVSILKSLDRRRKTLTELSKQFGMSPSTVKEHMDNLCSAKLVVQIDDGHKWKYYELTEKGKNILHPEETKIWILLLISVLGMVGVFYDLARRGFQQTFETLESAPMAMGEVAKRADEMLAPVAVETAASAVPYYHIAALVILAVVLGSCIAFLIINREKVHLLS